MTDQKLSDILRALAVNACFVEWEPPSVAELDALTLMATNLELLVERQRVVINQIERLTSPNKVGVVMQAYRPIRAALEQSENSDE